MKKGVRITIAVLLAWAAGYGFQVLGQGLEERKGLAPLPPLAAPKAEEAELGKMLFFDARLSGDATISCASCHAPEKAFADGQALSAGYPSTLYFRNTPTLLNSAYKKLFYWDGRLPGNDLPTVVRDHLSEAHFFQADGRLIIERLRQVPRYEEAFRKAYGGEPSYGKILNAVSAYVKSLASQGAPVDRFLAGDLSAISQRARGGLDLFQGKAACIQCHHGPLASDEAFHDLGVPENPSLFEEPLRHITFRRFFKTLGVKGYSALKSDIGRSAITKSASDAGKFKTPSLREAARTAPYMHNGVFRTLEEVVDFYDRGGGGRGKDAPLKPLGLSSREKGDLVEFLETLSGKEASTEAPPALEYAPRELGKN